jgi:prepilin-type N-terminal cleavage/methylation domain-containing protein
MSPRAHAFTLIAASHRSSAGAKGEASCGFTLIELLVVIAIIAILSVVVVLSLNPSEMLRRSRDSNRLSDMTTLSTAISHYQTDQSIVSGAGSLGNANTVYVSLPDPAATTSAGSNCSSLGLLTLPAGYTYQCSSPQSFRKTNGQGWIPVNFSSITTGSPLGQLPIDPINSSSSRLYYTYTTNGTQFETTAVMESANYGLGGANDQISNDGGTLASVYEKGSKLGLEPLDYGDPSLVGLWTFDEGTGTTAYDYSGNNASGSWGGSGTHWAIGRIGGYAGQFASTTGDYTEASNTSILTPTTAGSVSAWVDQAVAFDITTFPTVLNVGNYGGSLNGYRIYHQGTGSPGTLLTTFPLQAEVSDSSGHNAATFSNLSVGIWYFLAMTWDSSNIRSYINGALSNTAAQTHSSSPYGPLTIGNGYAGGSNALTGYIDDVRIYNRALSAAQIAAMYAGGK